MDPNSIARSVSLVDRRSFIRNAFLTAAAGAVVVQLDGCMDTGGPASASFATLSDTHLYDMTTLGSNADLETYLTQDRKMIKQSVQIFDAAMSDIKSWDVNFLVISGDLTKDGEKVNHQLMASKLKSLNRPVFVIPGNHDINNPNSLSYNGKTATTPNVSPADFRSIYADYGYSSAIYTDANSLSYIAEPVTGLWLFAIDSCKYTDNAALGYPVTSGAINASTLAWITSKLAEAKTKGKMAIGMMHHGLIEHFPGQATLFSEYLVDNRATLAATLAAAGLQVMFTGHYHANDVVKATYGGNTIYDIETGSTVTAPCPYRKVKVNLQSPALTITTSTVTATSDYPTGFTSFANTYLSDGLKTLVTYMLTSAPYSLSAAQVSALLPLIVPAMMAHYAGDEKLTDATVIATINALAASTDPRTAMIGQVLLGLWNDPPPADNNLSITYA